MHNKIQRKIQTYQPAKKKSFFTVEGIVYTIVYTWDL